MNTELNPSVVDDLAPEFVVTLDSTIIEAETMNLVNYLQESYSSENTQGTIISLIDKTNPPTGYDRGTAQTTFSGENGTYSIKLSFFDEVDGQGNITLKHNGTIISAIALDQDLPGETPSEQNRRTEIIATNVNLTNGDTLTLEGVSDITPRPGQPLYGEFARIDYLELIQDASAPQPPSVPDIDDAMAMEDGPDVVIDFEDQSGLTYRILTQPTNDLGQPEGEVRLDGGPTSVVPTPTEIITIEAEDLSLDGYGVDNRFEGIETISLITKQNGQSAVYQDQGSATGTFTGDAGLYTIEVGYYDESDGESQISFFLGDDTTQSPLDSWTLDDDANASPRPIKDGLNSNLKTRTISNVSLENGSEFAVQGIRDNEEGVRIDYIRFVPVAAPTPDPNLAFVFDPKPGQDFQDLGVGETREVVFTYEAENSDGTASEPGTVTVTVKGVNDAPVAVDDTAQSEEYQLPILIDLLENDSDIDNTDILTTTPAIVDTLVIAQINGQDIAVGGSVQLPSGALVTLNNDGVVTYGHPNGRFTPPLNDGDVLLDDFVYTLSDGRGGESTATVQVTVNGTTEVEAIDDAGMIDESTANPSPPNIISGNVLDNDTPLPLTVTTVNGQAAQVGQEIEGAYGTFVVNADGTYTYTLDDTNPLVDGLNDGETREEILEYTASDGRTTDGARLTVTINGKTDPVVIINPVTALDDVGAINESAPNPQLPNPSLPTTIGNVLSNDQSPNNATLTVTKVNGSQAQVGQPLVGAYGTFIVNADGQYVYELNDYNPEVDQLRPGETLTEMLEYEASDGQTQAGAKLTVQINGANDLPIAQPDTLPIIPEGNPVRFDASRLLSGEFSAFGATDVDPENTNIEITSVSRQSQFGGTVEYVNGQITYTPPLFYISHDINGDRISGVPEDTFTYVISDADGGESVGTVTVPVKDATFTISESEFNNCFSEADCQRLARLGAPGMSRGNEAGAGADIIPRSAFGVHPDGNVVDSNALRVQISGQMGRAQGRAEVDIFSIQLNQGEVVTLDVDGAAGNGRDFDTKLLVFDPSIVDNLINPQIQEKQAPIHRNVDAASVDPGSANLKDPYLEFTAEKTGSYFVAIATEDTFWKRTSGNDGNLSWRRGQFIKTMNNGDPGDYLLNVSIDNPQPLSI